MTPDPRGYELAEAVLKATGDDCDVFIHKLAAQLQDTIDDFMADLDNRDREEEDRDGGL